MNTQICKFLIMLALGGFILGLDYKPAKAFDSGHHYDLTRLVLKRHGLGYDAVNSALLANWLTDYYSSSPAIKNPLLKSALKRLHFDNLGSLDAVESYYHHFIRNVRHLTQEAARENDRIRMLLVIGVSLHVIQDFYAHSNWSDLYRRRPAGQFDVDLFPRPTVALKGKLVTGAWPPKGDYSHGYYKSGMNKDSHIRPGWENAFVMAHAATWQLAGQIRNWAESARPGFWQHTGSLNLSEKNRLELHRDLASARKISMSVRAQVLGLPASDGHWKGNRTGSGARFRAATQEFATWKNSFLARQFRETDTPMRMALDLDGNELQRKQIFPASDFEREFEGRAIIVKVHTVRGLPKTLGDLPIGARIFINGETYLGRVFSEDVDLSGLEFPAWHEIHIEPERDDDEYETSPSQLISIQLFARDTKSGSEILIDTNPDPVQTATLHNLSRKSGLMENLRQKLSGQKSGFLHSSGTGPNAAAITYSIEIHEID